MKRALDEPCMDTSEDCHSPEQMVPQLTKYYRPGRRIGSGSQGHVWLCQPTAAGPAVAVKFLSAGTDAWEELRAHRLLRTRGYHANILELLFSLGDRDRINLGFPLCRCDMLEYVLKAKALNELEASVWTRKLCGAIAHLHACNIVHLDVKLENIFIDMNGELKLGDLGLSACLDCKDPRLTKTCGSGVYAAPEVLSAKTYGPYDGRAADVWSIGVCSFIMVRGRFPFSLDLPMKRYDKFMTKLSECKRTMQPMPPPPPILITPLQQEKLSPLHLRLINQCLSINPSTRPSIETLLAFPWLVASREVEDIALAIDKPSPIVTDEPMCERDEDSQMDEGSQGTSENDVTESPESPVMDEGSPMQSDPVNTTPDAIRRSTMVTRAQASPLTSKAAPFRWRDEVVSNKGCMYVRRVAAGAAANVLNSIHAFHGMDLKRPRFATGGDN